MYVSKKHNRSGSTSVVVVSKAYGKNKEIQSFGTSSSEEDIESMCNKVAAWIRSFGGQQELDFDNRRGKEVEDTKLPRMSSFIVHSAIYCASFTSLLRPGSSLMK